jgi:hypothetical protein
MQPVCHVRAQKLKAEKKKVLCDFKVSDSLFRSLSTIQSQSLVAKLW